MPMPVLSAAGPGDESAFQQPEAADPAVPLCEHITPVARGRCSGAFALMKASAVTTGLLASLALLFFFGCKSRPVEPSWVATAREI